MIFNCFGESFYVWLSANTWLSQIVVCVYPWWMALLFSLAGISTKYALKRRSTGEYAKERVMKLLIPFVFGLLIVIPPQSYIADVFHNGYSGGYFEHYGYFFTHLTDLTGNDGAFTPGHLWFILYLFIITMVLLPLTAWYSKREKKPDMGKINFILLIIGGFIFISLMTLLADIGGKSLGDFTACFLLGFFILSDDNVLAKLKKYALHLGIAWAVLLLLRLTLGIMYYGHQVSFPVLAWDFSYKMLEWVGILAALGLGARFLNFGGRFTSYFAPAAFPLYYLHQTVLIVVAFFLAKLTTETVPFYIITVFGSFVLTVAVYELFRRTPVTRFMFGIKK